MATLSEATIEAVAEYFPPWMTVNNPLDVWIGVSKDFHTRYPRILDLVLRDEGVDSVICIYPSFTMPKHALYDSARHIRQCAKDHPEKPVLCWSYGLDIAGFTKLIEADGTSMVFPSLGAACLALTKLLEYRAVGARRPIERPRLEVNRARAGAVLERRGREDGDISSPRRSRYLKPMALPCRPGAWPGRESRSPRFRRHSPTPPA